MIDCATANHSINAIAIPKRLLIRFEHDHANPFSGHKAIATFAKSHTVLTVRNHLVSRKTDVGSWMQIEIHSSRQCHIPSALANVFTGFVNGNQCRGTHRVNNSTGALQVQIIGNPID